jgi:asparagine synthase (glutamine-hydrolysing)
MHPYVVLAWTINSGPSSLEAMRLGDQLQWSTRKLDLVLQSDMVRVYSGKPVDAAMRIYTLPNALGVVFGRLFRSDHAEPTLEELELDAGASARAMGQQLLHDYWGSYVAILRSHHSNSVMVLRDSSGRIPCYHASLAGLHVFFSDIADVEPLGLRFTLNERFLAAYILHHPLHVAETGLREVSEILAGDGVSISQNGACRECLWNPRLIAADRIIDDYDHAKAELVSVTEHVLRLWASRYDRILLNVSGGFDSAVVLGSLKRLGSSERVVCLNRYTPDTEDDERSYARAATELADVPLVELPRVSDAHLFVDMLQTVPPDPSPDLHKAVKMLAVKSTNEIAEAFHCDTVWSGQGGDHVFLQSHMPYSAADYLIQHTIPYRFPTMVYDSAVLSRCSVWSVLAQSLRYALTTRASPPEPFENDGAKLMTPAALRTIPAAYTTSHWHLGRGRVPPGKQVQIDMLSDLLNRHKPIISIERPYACNPLLSQPLLELSLRIPTYHLLRGGRQRAMARAAFSDRVPPCILSREDKGGTIDQVRTILRGSGTLLREALLDGTLVSNGILDRPSLERILVDEETYQTSEVFAILACIAIEMWARNWTERLPSGGRPSATAAEPRRMLHPPLSGGQGVQSRA